jgi:hypothetical protein
MGHVMDDVRRAVSCQSTIPVATHRDRCTGCGWDAPATPWNRISVLEVVNGNTIEGPTADGLLAAATE